MNLFLDCEFDGFQGPLLSMALISADGQTFYEVVSDACKNEWARENVKPKLNKLMIGRHALVEKLHGFLGKFTSIHIIADWPEDISHFCDCLQIELGLALSTFPKITFELMMAGISLKSKIPHNALSDALALKDAYNAVSQ